MKISSSTYPIGHNTPLYMPATSPVTSPEWRSLNKHRVGFGDPRRLNTFEWLSDLIHREQNCSINGITNTEAERKRAERFLNNEKCSVGEVIEKCCLSVDSPSLRGQSVLNIVDQSAIVFASAVGRMEGQERAMGRIGNGYQYGQNCVAGVFVRSDDFKVLGISSLSFHSDDIEATPVRERIGRDERPLHFRSSHKWAIAIEQARLRAGSADELIHVIDREADNLNFLLSAFSSSSSSLEEHVVIRSKYNRRIIVENDHLERGKVLSMMETCAAKVCYCVNVRSDERMSFSATYKRGKGGRKVERLIKSRKRKALLEVRSISCQLDIEEVIKSKSDMSREDALTLIRESDFSRRRLGYVQVREVDKNGEPIAVPKGKAKRAERPINWLIMTTLGVNTVEDVMRVVNIYRMRFPLIEQVFRGAKSDGIDLESAQHQSVSVLQKISAMALKSSVLVIKMIGARGMDEGFAIEDDFSTQEIEVLSMCLSKYEGKTELQANRHPTTQLSWAVWIIARMGGWKPGNRKRPPGPKTMQRGLDKFYNLYEGVALAKGWT